MKTPDADIVYAEHAADILAAALRVLEGGRRCALIASLAIEGGAAREVGSLAVVDADGTMTGYLSNGCIDRDIALQAAGALAEGKVRHLRYGAGSPFMDLKLPCGGALDLMIDPAPDMAVLRTALDTLEARRPATLDFCAARGLLPKGGTHRFAYAPRPALVLAGRGAIFRITATLGAQMGFDLHVASPDAADLDSVSDLAPQSLSAMTTPDAAPPLPVDAHTAVLLLFHDHAWEERLLMDAAPRGPFFIGAMGSPKTHRMRLAQLMANGMDADTCDTIRGPIGLVPSLRNASFIAVSALAEIVAALPPQQTQLPNTADGSSGAAPLTPARAPH